LFAVAAAMTAGLLASISPALKASGQPLVTALRGPAPGGAARAGRWGLREWLVAAQVAMTVVLLVVAGLFVRTVQASRSTNVGFETRGLAFVSFDTDMVRYSDEKSRGWWQQAIERARLIPGVRHASLASPRIPFELNFSTAGFEVEGRTYSPDHRGEIILNTAVSPEYFATLGVPIVRGRDFTEADREGSVPAVIVSEAMARKFWPSESAVGRSITLVTTRQRFEIVGVSADYKVRSVSEAPTPYVHFALMQRPASYNALMVRTEGDAEPVLRALKSELLAMEPNLVFVGQGTMERVFAVTLLPARIGSMMAAAFGGLGTVLAAIGLYGVVAFAVSRRTREIGIRLALGADRADVLRMILRQGGRVVLAGAVAGGVLAALAASLLGSVLYGITAADPLAWSWALAVLVVATTLAHLGPARRAIRIDPAVTLKDN
jgi:predicted permease